MLKPEFAARNVLVPPDGSLADEIRAAIGSAQRHKHFASLRSSQALAQSVFGAISAFGRLDVIEDITAECGRPAFFAGRQGWTLAFEHEVDTLGEPRATSIDVLLSGQNRQNHHHPRKPAPPLPATSASKIRDLPMRRRPTGGQSDKPACRYVSIERRLFLWEDFRLPRLQFPKNGRTLTT